MGESISAPTKITGGVIWPVLLVLGASISLLAYWRRDPKKFISANKTQSALPLSLNFIGSGIGCGLFAAFPQIANIAGLHGLFVYAIIGSLPMYLFAFLGPLIRKKTPNGFLLTEWVFHRYGLICSWYLSLCTLLTLFLFAVGDFSSLKICVVALTGMDPLPVIIAEAVITTCYTTIGGFGISFLTDSFQVYIGISLMLILGYGIRGYTTIDMEKVASVGLLSTNKLGWQLVYILTIAIFTNDLFLNGFWLRTFASRSDRDLKIACTVSCIVLTIFCIFVGSAGFLAVGAGLLDSNDPNSGSAFFLLLNALPEFFLQVALISFVTLSVCSLDSQQSCLVSTISNDLFRNKLKIKWARLMVIIIIIPIVLLSLFAENILSIYMFVDLLSSSVIPTLVVGFIPDLEAYWTSWEVIGGGFGGLFCTFLFGTFYYSDFKEGVKLLLIWNGLYAEDWSTFGAFVTAPLGGIIVSLLIMGVRLYAIELFQSSSKFKSLCVMIDNVAGLSNLHHKITLWNHGATMKFKRQEQEEDEIGASDFILTSHTQPSKTDPNYGSTVAEEQLLIEFVQD
ncbi:uncharacterized protein KNAG_0G01820 [Huiozyma naganishii CBS 8797]|uniref:Urea transport protein n=1 Tax=Huiozyma naganishii (strain ATCC MYA-139 / BCRC 22969 / CBS 8797 / KCTC 17520 / NBRC 10181 / NCYC 3082 / Yp74L-3) TaxID=1071383 RepID=J7R8P2_HUIN7|nr:hypothetical protein KNAG_0G01820 [Kazachstania naganishii CBS 8797]CCK71240.1 hypothetical protein KNAG_0G01820 [Kazachstania naganishii CBS 8797]